MLTIKEGDVIKVEYIGTLEDGTIFDSSQIQGGPLKLQIGAGQVIRGFEDQLIGMQQGEEKEFTLTPNEAYGEFNPLLLEKVPKTQFPEGKEIPVGKMIEYVGPNGMSSPAWVRLVEEDHVIIDMNPPLAGKTLHFEVKITDTGLEADPTPNPFMFSCNGCDYDHDH